MASPQSPLAAGSKRHLSSHSGSPLHDKKTKSYISPNRFAVLTTADDVLESDVFSFNSNVTERELPPPSKTKPNSIRMPAIYLKNVRNFSELNKKLIHLTGINNFSCKSTPSHLIIRANSHTTFCTIFKYLTSTSAEFHTFRPHYMRHFKVVIRNLHHTTTLTDISDALAEQGHTVVRVANISKNQRPLPLFHVELALNDNNHDIFKISTLLHSMVVIEKPHTKTYDPPQCFKCQAYGHTRNYCMQSPRCVKCGDEHHLTGDCTKERSLPAKCALCSGDHTASYKGCPIRKKLIQAKTKKKPKMSEPQRHEARTHHHGNNTNVGPTYANITSGQPTHIISDTTSTFLSELKTLLNPLLSLLTVIINKLTKHSP